MAAKIIRSEKVAALLKSALKRKRINSPGYSLRALARDLGVSPSFVSNVMHGKRLPPKDRLKDFFRILELDVQERKIIMQAALEQTFGSETVKNYSGPGKVKKSNRKTSEVKTKDLLEDWANLAVLEGLTLAPPHNDPEELRNRLGLTISHFNRALESLIGLGLVTEAADGAFVKNDDHLYVAGGRSRKEVRAFHNMMISKARTELQSKTSDEDYIRRLINGFTLAVDPQNLEQLKSKLLEFMDEFSVEGSGGTCREVYQFNMQFFPLTKPAKD